MLRLESKKAIQRFGKELQNVLETCERDADDLKSAYSKGPLGTGEEAVRFSSTMQTEVEQVRNKVPPLVRLSTDAPRAGDMLDASFAHLKAIANIFDRFEERLESAYDIAPVVPSKPEEQPVSEHESELPDYLFNSMSAISAMDSQIDPKLSHPSMTPIRRTPASSRRKDVDMPIPATPKPEDFGIISDDVVSELNALRSSPKPTVFDSCAGASATYRSKGAAQASLLRPSRHNLKSPLEVDFDGNFVENVQRSIREHDIQTNVQLEETYENKRHQAWANVMVSTTPKVKSGGVERTLDYTGLAEGYFRSEPDSEVTPRVDTHRQLNFDETPCVGGTKRVQDDEIREYVISNYDKLGFWRDKVNPDVLQDAVYVLRGMGIEYFTMDDLNRALSASISGISPTLLATCLTKIHVLLVSKRHGEEKIFRLVEI